MLGMTKKHSSRPTITSWWFCSSFTATWCFKETFQEGECKKLVALPDLMPAQGSRIFAEKRCISKWLIMVMRLILHWLASCSISALCLFPSKISDPKGKGWKSAFDFHSNLSASHEISACLLLAFSLDKQAFLAPVLFTHCSEVAAMGSQVHSLSWCSLDS